jgi:hypothetical protein
MRNLAGLAGLTTGALFLSSCVTYPYESAFSSCERQANDCYRICEDIPDERGYVNCQNYCDRDIDRCFDSAYSSYQSSYYGYGSSYGYGYSPSPWYGRYGTWYPSYGYALSFSTYDRYGYRKRRHNPPRYDGSPQRDRYYGQPGRGQTRDPSYRQQQGSRSPRGGQTQQPYPQTGGQQGGPAPGVPPVATPPPSSSDYRRGRRPPSPRDGDGRRIAPTEDPPEDRFQGRGGRMMDGTPSAREYRGVPQPGYTPPPAPAPSYDPPRQSDPAPSYAPPPQQSAPQPDYSPAPSYSEPPAQGCAPPERPSGPSSPRESEGNGETY